MTRAKWLLIGSETLPGKEIRDLVEERKLPVHLALATTSPAERILKAGEDELEVLPQLNEVTVEEAAVMILAGTPETHREALRLAQAAETKPSVVDATGALEGLPEARLCAPVLERPPEGGAAHVHVPAHPVAVTLARLVKAFARPQEVKRAVATVFEPASERGAAGLEELHQQTVNLFNLHKLPQAVFDMQAAFNLLPRYGEEAPVALASVETRIEKHLATLLGPLGLPAPSVRLAHAPVFHSYTASVWVELAGQPTEEEVTRRLTEAGFEVRGPDVEPASNTGCAGQSGVTVSDVARDRNNAAAYWMWLAFDNLRAHADNVLLTAALLSREARQ